MIFKQHWILEHQHLRVRQVHHGCGQTLCRRRLMKPHRVSAALPHTRIVRFLLHPLPRHYLFISTLLRTCSAGTTTVTINTCQVRRHGQPVAMAGQQMGTAGHNRPFCCRRPSHSTRVGGHHLQFRSPPAAATAVARLPRAQSATEARHLRQTCCPIRTRRLSSFARRSIPQSPMS